LKQQQQRYQTWPDPSPQTPHNYCHGRTKPERAADTNPTHKKKKEEEEEEEKLGCSSPSSIASMPKVTSSLT
jgi:hypothetical protein